MRKNTMETFKAWVDGKRARPARSIWTLGGVVYSYSTAIAKFSPESDRHMIVNVSRYSVTTTNQQRGLIALAKSNGFKVTEVDEDALRAF